MKELLMTVERAKAFLDRWILENVHDTLPVEDEWEAIQLACRCLEEADTQGITKNELEKAAGVDLVKCMVDAQVASANARIAPLVQTSS
ncbi:MAG TPA: hypothetical protein VIB38_04985 [Aestuariivirgaceae bacterium]